MPFPRSWLNCLFPTAALTSFTTGTKGPLVDLLPILVTCRQVNPVQCGTPCDQSTTAGAHETYFLQASEANAMKVASVHWYLFFLEQKVD